MTDDKDGAATETPMQRALRLKKTSLDAKAPPPGAERLQRKQTAGVAAGKSKPWMKK